MATVAAIIGRICIGILFVLAGLNKIMSPADTAQYIEAQTSLSGSLGMPVGVFEVVAGLVLASGFATRIMALALIGFTAVATVLFHNQVTDQLQAQMALKNLAIIGGLLMVFAYGQLRGWTGRMDKRHDAEVEEAREKGRAEGAASSDAPD